MRSNTIFAAGIVAASSVIAAPLNARADNGPLLPTTTASQAALTTETTGPLIPTTSASQAAQTTETTGPLIPTTTASGSASASVTPSSSSSVSQGTQSSTASGTASSSGTVTGTSTASSSGTATNSSSSTGTASSTGTGTASSTGITSSSGTATGTASSTVTGSATGSSSTSATGTNTSTGPAPPVTTGAPPVTTGPAPPVTTETPPPQVLTVLTTITDEFTSYVTYVPVTVTGNAAPTVTVTETVTVDGNGNGCAPTGTSTEVAPPSQSTNPSGGSSFYPSAIYHYDVSTGAITCGVEDGLIEKFPANKGHDITTLVTFTYPEESAGKQCQFEFFLSSASTLEGSGKIDVFTSLNPAPGCKASWPPGNQRNVHAGRLSAHVGAFATWDATYGASYLTEPTDCKAPGTQEGIELVGVYDEDHVAWFPDGSGARIIYN